jgi:hypothetical protein
LLGPVTCYTAFSCLQHTVSYLDFYMQFASRVRSFNKSACYQQSYREYCLHLLGADFRLDERADCSGLVDSTVRYAMLTRVNTKLIPSNTGEFVKIFCSSTHGN